ncbi:hypothetical protein [Pseudomonas sp. RA_35y_Pfl2_P32]|uniref:hypothetical protein n=1 Tax=Pseudomonas sp. RA_35y_Pfl2_P32 TaxID=3088705 RepID=UPI0030DB9312
MVSTIVYAFDDTQGIAIRLNPDGSLDKSFNDSGYVLIDLPGVERRTNHALGVTVQENGKVLVCGSFAHVGVPGVDAYVIRYDRSGRIDAQFGDDRNGVVKTHTCDSRACAQIGCARKNAPSAWLQRSAICLDQTIEL